MKNSWKYSWMGMAKADSQLKGNNHFTLLNVKYHNHENSVIWSKISLGFLIHIFYSFTFEFIFMLDLFKWSGFLSMKWSTISKSILLWSSGINLILVLKSSSLLTSIFSTLLFRKRINSLVFPLYSYTPWVYLKRIETT